MIDESLQEQASLYALELLEGEELRVFEKRMTDDAEFRGFVDELRDAAAKVAHGAPLRQPPAYLEAAILEKIRAAGVERPAGINAPGYNHWLPWALAACLAIACVVLAVDRAQKQKEVARLEARNAFAQLRIATLSSKLDSAPQATAIVLWDGEKQEGVIEIENIPANAENRDYQLWIVDPDYKQPVNGGTFHIEEKGDARIPFKPETRIRSADGFAVSLERKGGVSKAEGPMVLVGK